MILFACQMATERLMWPSYLHSSGAMEVHAVHLDYSGTFAELVYLSLAGPLGSIC